MPVFSSDWLYFRGGKVESIKRGGKIIMDILTLKSYSNIVLYGAEAVANILMREFRWLASTISRSTRIIRRLLLPLFRINSQRSVFPSQQALLKALYLATFGATQKWTMLIRNWGKVRGELTIMYPDRLQP